MTSGGARIVGGSEKGRVLRVPGGVRPTTAMSRRVLADTFRVEIEDAVILDLYAGSGVLTSELLSRGADRSVAVERSRRVAHSLGGNIEILGFESRVDIMIMPVNAALRILSGKGVIFDIVYADPPYSRGSVTDIDSRRIASVLKDAGLFIFEQRVQTDISSIDGFGVEWFKRIGDTRLIAYRRAM